MAIAIIERIMQIGYVAPNAIIGVWFTVFEADQSAGLMAQIPFAGTTTPTPAVMRAAVADEIVALSAASGFTISIVGGNRQILFQDLSWAPA